MEDPSQSDLTSQARRAASGLRVLSILPEFTLTDQSGRTVGLEDFRGYVWIGNFMFTRCVATCPRQTAMLVRLQDELKPHAKWGDIRLVSFTVEPDYDTPEVLSNYARNHGADQEQWKFLTGTRDAIWSLSIGGFKLPVVDAPPQTAAPILHSPRFILVDRKGRVRGYYDSGDDSELLKLRRDLEAVLDEPLPAPRGRKIPTGPPPPIP